MERVGLVGRVGLWDVLVDGTCWSSGIDTGFESRRTRVRFPVQARNFLEQETNSHVLTSTQRYLGLTHVYVNSVFFEVSDSKGTFVSASDLSGAI